MRLCCRQIQSHKQGMAPLQEKHADAARRQKEIDMKSHKLGDHLDKARAHADQWDKTTAEHSDSAPLPLRTPCRSLSPSLVMPGAPKLLYNYFSSASLVPQWVA